MANKILLVSAIIFLTGCIAAITIQKEVKDMAMVYVSLIIKGRRTYKSVPALLKPQVKEILIDLELEYLIDEE